MIEPDRHLQSRRRAAIELTFRITAALLLVFALVAIADGFLASYAEQSEELGSVVYVSDVSGPIGPPSAHFVADALDQAVQAEANALVLRINTPGGLATSMREIITEILASGVPVIGYVAPSGGHAASAGTYILYATHVAAMAPGTNLGAAMPVQLGGLPSPPASDEPTGRQSTPDGDNGADDNGPLEPKTQPPLDDPATAKSINDAVAYLQSLAELRGRNTEWAEAAVRQAASLSAQEALRLRVIDLIAEDLDALLHAVDGVQVEIRGVSTPLRTIDARVVTVEPSLVTQVLAMLSNPNVAFLLMMLGAYGLIFEFANPGIGPGIPGIICLLLGLYALNQLPLNYAGFALLTLGLGFMLAEALTPSFGIFGIGGIVAFSIGAAMLIDTDVPAYQLSWNVIATATTFSALVVVLLIGLVWRAQRRSVRTGRRHMIGESASIIDWSGATGHVWAEGERWEAVGSSRFAPGDTVNIEAVEGLTLKVGRRDVEDGERKNQP